MTQYVFVTGGVVSSLGKGIASASLAAILEARGLEIAMIKLDPYINAWYHPPHYLLFVARLNHQQFATR